MKTNLIQDKSFAFAVRIVRTYQRLVKEEKEYILSKQLVRSGTSVGANIEEAIGGYSTGDFLYKINISYKECRETVYWLRLMLATDYLSSEMAQSLISDAKELCRILGKIQITTKANKLEK